MNLIRNVATQTCSSTCGTLSAGGPKDANTIAGGLCVDYSVDSNGCKSASLTCSGFSPAFPTASLYASVSGFGTPVI